VAVIILASVLAGAIGALVFFGVQWRAAVKRGDTALDEEKKASIDENNTRGKYARSLEIIAELEDSIRRMKISSDVASETLKLITDNAVKKVNDEETANLVRAVLAHYELQAQLPSTSTPKTPTTSHRESGSAVHETATRAASESE